MRRFALLCTAVIAFAAFAMTGASGRTPQREDPEFLYDLHCSGCHKRDGSGQGVFVPRLQGQVAKFLHKPGGREFLIQVPGVSQSMLSNKQVATVMNWALVRFDREHMPADFKPITEREAASLRQKPITDSIRVRAEVLAGTGAKH